MSESKMCDVEFEILNYGQMFATLGYFANQYVNN